MDVGQTPPAAANAFPPTPTGWEEALRLPPGAVCARHREAAASFECIRCGSFGCAACVFGGPPGGEVCLACAERGLSEPVPWERRKAIGWVKAFWQTTKLVCLRPREVFRTPSVERGPAAPLMYGVSAYLTGQVLYYLVMVAFFFLFALVAGVAGGLSDPTLGATVGGILGMYGCVLLGMLPLMLAQMAMQGLLGVVLGACFTHGILALAKKSTVRFEETLRVVAYANAPYFFLFVPVVGVFVYFWMWRIEYVAVVETHRVSGDWAFLATVGYRILILLAVAAVYVGLFALIFLFEGSQAAGAGGF